MSTDQPATAASAGPPDASTAEEHPSLHQRIGGVMGMIAGFVPWIAYWAMLGSVSFHTAVLVAFGLAAAVFLVGLRHGVKILELGTMAVFAALVAVTFLGSDAFLERWMQPLSNAGLFTIALVSVLVGKPFTLQYAEDAVTPDVAAGPGFIYLNSVITWIWVGAFGIMTASSTIPPIVQGDATFRDGGSTLSIVCYWVIPFTVLGMAGLVSSKLPDLFVSRMAGLPDVDPPAPEAPLPTDRSADRPQVDGARLEVLPDDGLLDDPFAVRARALPPGTQAELTTTAVDAAGHRWTATASFEVGDDGTLDTTTSQPRSGDWSDPDPAAPLWAMRFATAGVVPDLFLPPPSPWAVDVSLAVRGGPTLTRTALRRPTNSHVQVRDVPGDGFAARLWLPAENAAGGGGGVPGVVLFPGSEGGLDSQAATAGLLASHGYAAMVACVHGAPDLPEALVEIPLERFVAAAQALVAQPEVDGGRVAAMAISKGSEGLLAAASMLNGFPAAALVAVSPSSVLWQAIGDDGAVPDTGTWTLGGEALPFVSAHSEALMGELLHNALTAKRLQRRHQPALMHLRAGYQEGLGDTDAVAAAAVPAERIAVPVLFAGGSDDQVWPSPAMIDALSSRRADAGVDRGDERQVYDGAGHLLRFPHLPADVSWTGGIALGGTPAGTAAAQADFRPRVLAFLGRTLGV
ncbi:MAG: acyl-CoA thioesterase/BAAT N-terminal domain-containing protein [Acidimicrobiia bacterium]|nr:acyl-CoA thioesterase/BAAT N-terminal domain-containing protein [Acidimicrobiia bacterium]